MLRWCLVLSSCLVACGRIHYEASPSADGGLDATDSSPVDAITIDSHPMDSEARDSAVAVDTAVVDTAVMDAGPEDIGVADTGEPDVLATSCPGTSIRTCPDVVRAIGRGESIMVMGSTDGLADRSSGSCGGGGAGEFVLQLDLASFGFYDITTDGSDFDTVVYVRDGDCSPDGVEVACRDDVVGSGGEALTLGAGHAGAFYVVVDGAPAQCGMVQIRVDG